LSGYCTSPLGTSAWSKESIQNSALPHVAADDHIDVALPTLPESNYPGQRVIRVTRSHVDRHVRCERRPEAFAQDATVEDEQILIERRAAHAVGCQRGRSNERVSDLPACEVRDNVVKQGHRWPDSVECECRRPRERVRASQRRASGSLTAWTAL
jgi:hypothetical protein